jgi:DNA replication protein DnaC
MTALHQKLNQLNLTTMSRHLDQTISDAATKNLSFAPALESLTDMELESRNRRSIDRRFRDSRLYTQHSIDAFNFKHHKSRMELKPRILRLLDLEFLRKGTSAILIGNPGVGKTFLAKIIGWRVCQANRRVLFTTAVDMLNHLLASQVDHSLIRKLKTYTEPTLLICDELGYLSLDQQTSNLFYQVISTGSGANRSGRTIRGESVSNAELCLQPFGESDCLPEAKRFPICTRALWTLRVGPLGATADRSLLKNQPHGPHATAANRSKSA